MNSPFSSEQIPVWDAREHLTQAQIDLIAVYQDKWRAIAFQTGEIDRQEATAAVKASYAAIGEKEPEIIFCPSPYAAIKHEYFREVENQLDSKLERQLIDKLCIKPVQELNKSLGKMLAKFLEMWLSRTLTEQVWYPFTKRLAEQLEKELDSESWKQVWMECHYCIFDNEWSVSAASVFDYCYEVLNCNYNPKEWLAFQALIKNCGWVMPFKGTCIVCDRPTRLSLEHHKNLYSKKSYYYLHAEGEPAIEFADGYSLYFYHGVALPEEYGKIPPHEWQAQWLLKEENAAIRRMLVERIGYERICQELAAEELDNWQEYTLLKIDHADIEPIFLLKMNCPSTGSIHVLRVPPEMQTARSAIRWCNWGIDPEEFSFQT